MYAYRDCTNWGNVKHSLAVALANTSNQVDVGEWHSQPIDDPMLQTREMGDVLIECRADQPMAALVEQLKPNLPWAEEHFQERVSGEPLNPPPSHEHWPWAHQQHQNAGEEKFSHTYPERYWPKMAGAGEKTPEGRQVWVPQRGIRFEYGDLNDVIQLLKRSPHTRQAYMPIYFPEDVALNLRHPGMRVPCSLGYHFIRREGRLHLKYFLRSCDFVRHWADDMYMHVRLLQHVSQLTGMPVGKLTTWITSLHVMEGDLNMLQYKLRRGEL